MTQTTETPTCRAWRESAWSSDGASECCGRACANREAASVNRRRRASSARQTYKSACSTACRLKPDVERAAPPWLRLQDEQCRRTRRLPVGEAERCRLRRSGDPHWDGTSSANAEPQSPLKPHHSCNECKTWFR